MFSNRQRKGAKLGPLRLHLSSLSQAFVVCALRASRIWCLQGFYAKLLNLSRRPAVLSQKGPRISRSQCALKDILAFIYNWEKCLICVMFFRFPEEESAALNLLSTWHATLRPCLHVDSDEAVLWAQSHVIGVFVPETVLYNPDLGNSEF